MSRPGGSFSSCALSFLLLVAACATSPSGGMKIEKSSFGTTSTGEPVELYTLRNVHRTVAKVITWGATLTELHVADRRGDTADVVLGFETLAGWQSAHPYFGVTVGRVANRIAKGKFTLEGATHTLATNNGPNHLHGGNRGFDKVVWKASEVQTADGPGVRFTHVSKAGDEGYPGTLTAAVTYVLTNADELVLHYEATTDAATPVNLTHHSYFNLTGDGNRDILGHRLTVFAARYTPTDETLIPTGEIAPVDDTPFDFRKPFDIGARLRDVKGGYDLNFALDSGGGRLAPAAVLHDPASGRIMRVHTTEPGLQFYTGNFLDGSITGKRGAVYRQHAGLCLEAQHFPDAINQPGFAPIVLRPGKVYRQTTRYAFTTDS